MSSEIVWPFYIVCDVSSSMHRPRKGREQEKTPYDAMLEGLHDLIDFTLDHVEASDIAHLGVLTFADEAQISLPLTKMKMRFQIPPLPKGTFTNYAKAFSTTARVVATDVAALERKGATVRRPTVFFITDGNPEVDGNPQSRAAWGPPLRELQAISAVRPGRTPLRIAVVALGFQGARGKTLVEIAQVPGLACIATPGVATPSELMESLLVAILNSITQSVHDGDLDFVAPNGMEVCT